MIDRAEKLATNYRREAAVSVAVRQQFARSEQSVRRLTVALDRFKAKRCVCGHACIFMHKWDVSLAACVCVWTCL